MKPLHKIFLVSFILLSLLSLVYLASFGLGVRYSLFFNLKGEKTYLIERLDHEEGEEKSDEETADLEETTDLIEVEEESKYPIYSFVPSEYYDEEKLKTYLPFFYLHNEREEKAYRELETLQNGHVFNGSNTVYFTSPGNSVWWLGMGVFITVMAKHLEIAVSLDTPLFIPYFPWWRYGESDCGGYFCIFEAISNHTKYPDYFYNVESYSNQHPEVFEILNRPVHKNSNYFHGSKYAKRDQEMSEGTFRVTYHIENLNEKYRYDDLFSRTLWNENWLLSQYVKYFLRPNPYHLRRYMDWIEEFKLTELFTNGEGYAAIHIRVGPIRKNKNKVHSDSGWKIHGSKYVDILEHAMRCSNMTDSIKYLYVATDNKPSVEEVRNSKFIKKMGIHVLSASWEHRKGIVKNNMLQIAEIEDRLKAQKSGKKSYRETWSSRNGEFVFRDCGVDAMFDIYMIAQSKIFVGSASSFSILGCMLKGDELCFDAYYRNVRKGKKEKEFIYRNYVDDEYDQDWSKWGFCDKTGHLLS